MDIKMAINSQLSTTESKKQKQILIKQTTTMGTELQIQRSFGGLSAGTGEGENRGTGTRIKKHNW